MQRLISLALAVALASLVLADTPTPSSPSIAALIANLSAPKASQRLSAIEQLGAIGAPSRPAVAKMLHLLRTDPDAPVRKAAGRALAQIGSAALPGLIEAIGTPDANVRQNAIAALKRFGPEAVGGVPVLRQVLHDKDAGLRVQAMDTLGEIGPSAGPAAPDLVQALREQGQLHTHALIGLVKIGQPAVPALRHALEDKLPAVRRRAARALALIGPAAGAAAPDLVRTMERKDGQLRQVSLGALASMGASAKVAVPALVRKLEKPELQDAAVTALANIGAEAVPALISTLASRSTMARVGALRTLAVVGIYSPQTVSALIKALNDPNRQVRVLAALTLGDMGVDALLAVPALMDRLRDTDADVRFQAAVALGEIGPKAIRAVPSLLATLKTDTNVPVRVAAGHALLQIQPQHQSAPLAVFTRTKLIVELKQTPTPLQTHIVEFARKINPRRETILDRVFDLFALVQLHSASSIDMTAMQIMVTNLGDSAIPAMVRTYNKYGDLPIANAGDP